MGSPPETAPGTGRRRSVVVFVLAGAVAFVAAATLAVVAGRGGGDSAAPAGTTVPATSIPSVADLYRMVGPSVVVITTADGTLGTGVVAADDGTIFAANHVIPLGTAVTVTFFDGTETTAAVADANPELDLITLKPAALPELLVPAVIGGNVAIGDDVVAIGHPLGFGYSVSSGVVSGIDRTAAIESGELSGLIQFDASVNQGSSGGPLLNAQGYVIGIVVALADPGEDGAFAGVGFAVPIGSAVRGAGGAGDNQGPRL